MCPACCGLQRAYDDASSTAGDNLLHLVMSFFSASGVQGGQLLACAGSAAKRSLLNESPAGRRGCCREEEPGFGEEESEEGGRDETRRVSVSMKGRAVGEEERCVSARRGWR